MIPYSSHEKNLHRLLTSIEKQTCQYHIEVLVIQNSRAVPKTVIDTNTSYNLDLRYLQSKQGANSARNLGIDSAVAEVLFFIDDDCELDGDSIVQAHIDYHMNTGSQNIFGGLYKTPVNSTFLQKVYHDIQMNWIFSNQRPDGSFGMLLGGHFSISKKNAMKLRFDDQMQYGGTETEFFIRAIAAKINLALKVDLALIHHPHLSLLGFVQKAFRQGEGTCYIERKFLLPLRFVFYATSPEKTSPKRAMVFFSNLYDVAFQSGYRSYAKKKIFLGQFRGRVLIEVCLGWLRHRKLKRVPLDREKIRILDPEQMKFIFNKSDKRK